MNETELERLVVRLLGDATSYLDMLSKAQAATKQAADEMKKHHKEVEGFAEKMEGFAAGVTKVLAAVGIGAGFESVLEKFEEFEKTNLRMEAALKANGREVEDTMKVYDEFSRTMANTTLMTVNETKALLDQAENFDVTGKAAENLVRQATAASKMLGGSPEAAMGLAAALQKGDRERAMHFTRHFQSLRGVTDEMELVDKWEKAVAGGTELMGKEMETATAKIEKAKQQMGLLGVEAGGVIAEGLKPLAEHLTEGVKWFNELDKGTRQSVASSIAFASALFMANEAGSKFLTTSKALALNPLTWVAVAVAATIGLANAFVEASEGAKKLKQALEDLDKWRKKEAKDRSKNFEDFLGEDTGPKGLQERLDKNMKELKDLADRKKQAEDEIEEKSRSHYNPLEWAGKQFYKQMGGEFGAVAKEQLKDVAAAVATITEENEKLEKQLHQTGKAMKDNMVHEEWIKLMNEMNTASGNVGVGAEEQKLTALMEKHLKPEDAMKAYHRIIRLRVKEEGQKMSEELAKAGMSDLNQKQAEWMLKGLTGVDLYRLKQQAEVVKLKNDAYSVVQGQRSPEEVLKERVGELSKELARGMLTWEQYGRAVLDARNKIYGAAAAITPAVDATSNAARVLMYDSLQKIRPSLPDAGNVPLPMMNWPGAGNPLGGAGGVSNRQNDNLIRAIEELTSELKKQAGLPKISVTDMGH